MKKGIIMMALVVLLLPSLVMAHAGEDNNTRDGFMGHHSMMGDVYPGGNYMMSGNAGWLFSFMGILFWIAVFVTVVLLALFLYRKVNEDSSEILKERFARGEISKKEFEDMKRKINKR